MSNIISFEDRLKAKAAESAANKMVQAALAEPKVKSNFNTEFISDLAPYVSRITLRSHTGLEMTTLEVLERSVTIQPVIKTTMVTPETMRVFFDSDFYFDIYFNKGLSKHEAFSDLTRQTGMMLMTIAEIIRIENRIELEDFL